MLVSRAVRYAHRYTATLRAVSDISKIYPISNKKTEYTFTQR